MIATIELGVTGAYVSRMRAFAMQAVVILAILLMPLGMSDATASASHASPRAAMPMQHCPGPHSGHSAKAGFAECTMACAAALPAADLPRSGGLTIVCEPATQVSVQRLEGLHPETATPPPRGS